MQYRTVQSKLWLFTTTLQENYRIFTVQRVPDTNLTCKYHERSEGCFAGQIGRGNSRWSKIFYFPKKSFYTILSSFEITKGKKSTTLKWKIRENLTIVIQNSNKREGNKSRQYLSKSGKRNRAYFFNSRNLNDGFWKSGGSLDPCIRFFEEKI